MRRTLTDIDPQVTDEDFTDVARDVLENSPWEASKDNVELLSEGIHDEVWRDASSEDGPSVERGLERVDLVFHMEPAEAPDELVVKRKSFANRD